MPSPKICNKIKDPKKRQQCKNYEGPYAKRDIDNNGKRSTNGSMQVTNRNKRGY